MSEEIKAIQTKYRGYFFRSRLEARYAVFFSHLKIPFDYEREPYSLPSGPYLPDFWMPTLNCWIEIKPKDPTELALNLARELAELTKTITYIFCGRVPGYKLIESKFGYEDYKSAHAFFINADGKAYKDTEYAFCVCNSCNRFSITKTGRTDYLGCKECLSCFNNRNTALSKDRKWICTNVNSGGCSKKCHRTGNNSYSYDHPFIMEAVYASRHERFEKKDDGYDYDYKKEYDYDYDHYCDYNRFYDSDDERY